MKAGTIGERRYPFDWKRSAVLLLAFACLLSGSGRAQDASANSADATGDDADVSVATLPVASTAQDRSREAWSMLTDAASDAKHPTARIQALAALGMLRSSRSEKMIVDAMDATDLDVRTAAALAAGQTGDRNLTTSLRNLLDDKEPQVAFTAAMTLWKMNDRSGEDILMAVVDGDRSAGPSMMHGTEHKIDKDLHNPAMLARVGAMQGAEMFMGPFGYGITAFQFIHQSGGNLARAAAIGQIAQERSAPIHKELLAALGDKDPMVRAAAAKGLVDYRDPATSTALYALFTDPKIPVRLTAAAAYLRTTGTPGPPTKKASRVAKGREE